MSPGQVALVGAFVVGFALISRLARAWPLTMPMVFVAVGAALAATGLADLETEISGVGLAAELALAVILFSDAVRIDLRALRRNALVPARLLLIGLPLTIVAGTAVNSLLFPAIALAEVALLAAILAPTDAALGSAVVEDERVPLRERLALNVESGLNDGLVVPVVTILTAIVLTGGTSATRAARVIVEELGLGIAVGAAVGASSILLLSAAHRRRWADGRYEQIATFSIPLIAFFAADALNGSGFIAAFVAGLVFGGLADSTLAEHLGEFTEDAAQLLGIGAFFLFGNVFVGEAVGSFEPAVWVAALLSLTLVRIVPVWISQTGTGRRWQTRLFLGWFGPRGLASIVFGILLVEEAEASGMDFGDALGVINVTVTASVLLHGVTAAWGARTYGTWAARAEISAQERAEMYMDEMDPSMAPRCRWSPRRTTPPAESPGQTST